MFKAIKIKIEKAKALASLGATKIDKRTLFLKSFTIPFNNRLKRRNYSYRVTIEKNGRRAPLYLEGTYDELLIMQEILKEEQYKVGDVKDPKVIVDLGSNIGISVVYFALTYPNAIIHACEAHPTTAILLKKNTLVFGDRVKVHTIAINLVTEEVVLHSVPGKNIASSVTARAGSKPYGIVLGITMDDFVEQQNIEYIDILKFDIEGSEYNMLKSFTKRDMVQRMIGEVHFDLMNVKPDDFWELLRGFEVDAERANKRDRFVINATHI